MADEAFNLVFRGEVLEGQMAPDVKLRLGRLLKIDNTQVATMFAGEPVVLKRAVDRATAAQYQAAFRKVGARLRVLPAGGPEPGQTPPPDPDTAPRTPARKPSLAERLAAQETPPAAARPAGARTGTAAHQVTAAVPEFGLAPAGVEVLRPQERRVVEPVHVDTSGLTVAEPGVALVEPVSRPVPELDISHLSLADLGVELGAARRVPALQIDVPELTLAETGALLASPHDNPAVYVDTSGLSLAEPGTALGEPRPAPHGPPPNTSHLRVE